MACTGRESVKEGLEPVGPDMIQTDVRDQGVACG